VKLEPLSAREANPVSTPITFPKIVRHNKDKVYLKRAKQLRHLVMRRTVEIFLKTRLTS
jgi:hypothetical protein